MRIDAHQHFWQLSRGDYDWLTPDLATIYRDFLPKDLSPLLGDHRIDGTILVQAAPTEAETDFLLALSLQHNFIHGVVGWTDFEAADVEIKITALAQHPKFVGLRPMIQDISDPDWMLSAALKPTFEAMQQHQLTFDALTLPMHLPRLIRLVRQYPELTVVIDHASKPDIKNAEIDVWAEHMRELAKHQNCYCKFSGMVTEAAENWSLDSLQPYCDVLLDSFGPDRLIWGSDWPVCTLAANYEQWLSASEQLLSELDSSQLAAVFGDNAARAYRLAAPDH